MRAAVITADQSLTTAEIPLPEPAVGEVRITVAYSGVCGSDLHLLHGNTKPAGFVLGHEFTGAISAVGSEVDDLTVGDRVTVLALAGCGECELCQLGHESACAGSVPNGPGLARQGGLAEEVVVPADRVIRLPENVDDRSGALAEPLAVAVHAVATAGITAGDTRVVVLGAGPVGLLVAEVLRAREVNDLVLVEPREHRRDCAANLGWLAITPEEATAFPAGTRVVVFDCTGHPAGFALAQELMPVGAVLVMVGMTTEPVQLNGLSVMVKEWTIRGSLGYNRQDMLDAIDYLAAGRIRTDQLISREVGLAAAAEVFADLADPGSNNVKVLLRPHQ